MKTQRHKPFSLTLSAYGLDFAKLRHAIKATPRFVRDVIRYRRENRAEALAFAMSRLQPVLTDFKQAAGAVDRHYFFQDWYVARQIYERSPQRHVDIGSRVDGFISSLLVFRSVEFIDIRPLPIELPGLHFIQDDATELRTIADGSIESLSCLHAAEHFGLGRYGDPVRPAAPWEFTRALARVLAPGGVLYFSVPTGREALYFNAHRVFAPSTVTAMFEGLTLTKTAGVLDDGEFHDPCPLERLADQAYGCGIYEFRKPQ